MKYTNYYSSPLGKLLMAADDIGLTGLWFENQLHYAYNLDPEHQEKELPVFNQTKQWLDLYFSGQTPDFTPPIHMTGTPFQTAIWNILEQIPYAQTTTYGDIAAQIAKQKGIAHMSAQAVGQAVGRNKISIIIPCHRVIGKNGTLTGYAGGLDKKTALLSIEKII